MIETGRGLRAVARWLAGTPAMNRAMSRAASRDDARRILIARSERFLADCRIEVRLDGIPPPVGRACVACYNETSFADVFALSTALLPHVDRAAAADVYARLPFARAAARRAAIEMVPRGNRAATGRLMDKVVGHLRAGERLAWGGEGRLTGMDGVARFKVGASLIAIRAGVPLVPVAFHGGHQCWPLRSFRTRPGIIAVRIGEPIPTTGLGEDDARALADRVQASVAGLYADLATRADALAIRQPK